MSSGSRKEREFVPVAYKIKYKIDWKMIQAVFLQNSIQFNVPPSSVLASRHPVAEKRFKKPKKI